MNFIPKWIDSSLFPIPTIQNIPKWNTIKELYSPIKQNNHTYYILYSQKDNVTSFSRSQKKALASVDNNNYIQTEYSLLYLHGYTSSPKEQYPLLDIISKKLRANAISIRMDGHGIPLGSMHFLSQERWYQSALEGLATAKKLGKKVIIISCSTGSTLGLLLSTRKTAQTEQSLHICISPNLGIYLSKSIKMLSLHSLIQKIIYFISYFTKKTAIVLKAKVHNSFHTSITTLDQPISAVHPMLQLVYLAWKIRRKTPQRFVIPTMIFAKKNDTVVDFSLTKKFFKTLRLAQFVQLPTTKFEHSHVLAGDALSPSTTVDMANAILNNINTYFQIT